MNHLTNRFSRAAAMIGQALLTMLLFVPAPVFAQAKSFEVLHRFTKSKSDGATPLAGLLLDSAGNLYGTTKFGGAGGKGTVFELTPNGTFTLLHSFCATTPCDGEGLNPVAALIRDRSGNLYGTTTLGPYPLNNGTVFRLSPTGDGQWQESILYGFKAIMDGYNPKSGVIRDAHGNLYGTTYGYNDGGTTGMVYELTPTSSGPWTETDLFTFSDTTIAGGGPVGGLLMNAQGNIYGTTTVGGPLPQSKGTVFMLKRGPNAPWTETTLYNFTGQADGGSPEGNLLMDAEENIYSTTSSGNKKSGGGTMFELTPSTLQLNTLWSFCSQTTCLDGRQPLAGLIRDAQGNLYGTTSYGGNSHGLGNSCPTCSPNRYGVVFKLDPLGNETILYNFTGGTDGSNPAAGLVMDGKGNLYGTTSTGGNPTCICGTVFKIVQ